MEADPIQAQHIAARRNQILEAAIKVFADKGFTRTTIKDIAHEAGIADGTIYNYFDNKTALLLGILDRMNETANRYEDFAKVAQTNVREWASQYIRQRYYLMYSEYPQIFRVLLPEILVNKELRDLYVQKIVEPTFAMAEIHFDQWKAQGLVADLDGPLTLRAISAMFLGLLLLHLMGEPVVQARWDELPELMSDLLLDGLMGGGKDA